MRAPLLVAALAAFVGLPGCGAAEPEPATPDLALTVPLFVDDDAGGVIRLPQGPGPWPLVDHLPPGTPAYDSWTRLTVEGASGRVFTRRSPAQADAAEEARFFRRPDGVAFAVFLVAGPDAPKTLQLRADRPALTVPSPTAVRIRTVDPAPEVRRGPLRITRDGAGPRKLTDAEFDALERVAEPGKPNRVEAIRLADVVALRAPRGAVRGVTIRASAEVVEVAPPDLDEALLKPTRKGAWVFKQFDGAERRQTLRDVVEIDVRTAD